MNPGDLRHRIIIQKESQEQSKNGALTGDWIPYKNVWASINPLSGKDFFAAETINSEVTHKVNIRYINGITPDMRISYKGRIFLIISIINFREKNVYLQLMCKELV